MRFKFGKFQFFGMALVVILFGISIWYPQNYYKQGKVVVAFGDSLTRGYGMVPPGKNYVVFLSEYIHVPIINSGKTGDTTSDALVRLQADVLDKKPDIVIVFLGGNDYFMGYNPEVIKANLATMIKKIRGIGAKVILIGTTSQIQPEYESVIKQVATDEKVFAYIPGILDGILFRKDLLYDTIHPNDKGHELVAQKILPVLQGALNEN
ncbi:MAG: GDSL-type esterase/lipase family protein [bacterium]|nr:GDSL-type esterase/lipase family protein [bacterium]